VPGAINDQELGAWWRRDWRGAALARDETTSRISFQCEEGQNIGLNKRLPRITQRDVLSSGSVRIIYSRTKRQTTRWVVRGSRLFKEICGHTRAEKNSARYLGCDPKRLPSSPLLAPALITVAPQIKFDDAPPSATKIWPVT
jgi:hypothetical protein